MTCTSAICGRAHMHIWDLRTCTYAICGRAIVSTWKQLHVHKSQMCMCVRLQIAYVQVCKSQMCMCARPQIVYVHVMTAATYMYQATIMSIMSTCTCMSTGLVRGGGGGGGGKRGYLPRPQGIIGAPQSKIVLYYG